MTLNNSSLFFFIRKITTLLFFAAILLGCAPKLSISTGTGYSNELNFNTNSLWKIVIVQGGEEKFSGILAIQHRGDFISLALLDPTGITLLKGDVFQSGNTKLASSLEIIKKNKIERYIGKAVFRIFYLPPSEDTCRKSLNRLCWRETDFTAFNAKISTFGPFLFWSVSYFCDGRKNERITAIEYNTPWNKTKILLEFMS